MIELPLLEFCEITGQSRQIVSQKIKQGKIKSRKDENGRVFIIMDLDLSEVKNTETQELQDMFGALFVEYKELINKLESSYKERLNDKDKENEELKKEIERLREELKKSNSGLLKRLFG